MTQKHLVGFLLLALCFIFSACASQKPDSDLTNPLLARFADSPAIHTPPVPLTPQARVYTGDNAPFIRYVAPTKAAAKAGLRAGDEILRLNGQRTFTVADLERHLHFAPATSTITFRRQHQIMTAKVFLGADRPRLGALLEPLATPLIKQSSPYIAYEHVDDVTVYAETSINPKTKELHLNLIMQSMKPIAIAQMEYALQEKGKTEPLARGFESVDALGSESRVFSKVIPAQDHLQGPVQVSVNIENHHFHFEFQ